MKAQWRGMSVGGGLCRKSYQISHQILSNAASGMSNCKKSDTCTPTIKNTPQTSKKMKDISDNSVGVFSTTVNMCKEAGP